MIASTRTTSSRSVVSSSVSSGTFLYRKKPHRTTRNRFSASAGFFRLNRLRLKPVRDVLREQDGEFLYVTGILAQPSSGTLIEGVTRRESRFLLVLGRCRLVDLGGKERPVLIVCTKTCPS